MLATIQPVISLEQLADFDPTAKDLFSDFQSRRGELIIREGTGPEILVDSIDYIMDVFVDWELKEPHWHRDGVYYIQKVFNPRLSNKDCLRTVNRLDPTNGELEVRMSGREELLAAFRGNDRVLSLPLLTFIDGFGVFRPRRSQGLRFDSPTERTAVLSG